MRGHPGESLCFHLAQLDFSEQASFRGPPAQRTCCLLASEILTDGFVTKGDPLLATPAFAIGFVKGSTRICTLHTLATLLLDDDFSMAEAWVGGRPGAKRCLAQMLGTRCRALLGPCVDVGQCRAPRGQEVADPVLSAAWSMPCCKCD